MVMDDIKVCVYSAERTLADCFKYRNKIGIDVCVEALSLYRHRGRMKLDRLEHYAKLCRVERVMRPYGGHSVTVDVAGVRTVFVGRVDSTRVHMQIGTGAGKSSSVGWSASPARHHHVFKNLHQVKIQRKRSWRRSSPLTHASCRRRSGRVNPKLQKPPAHACILGEPVC